MFTTTKKRSGYYLLHVDHQDGTICTCDDLDEGGPACPMVISRHTSPEELIEKGIVAKLAHPGRRVFAKHDYELEIDFENAPKIVAGVVGQPFKVGVVPLDPTVATGDGGFATITPHKPGDIAMATVFLP